MLAQVADDRKNKPPELSLPLIRLKIENSGYSVIKSKRINDHFINSIANQSDFLQFYKKGGYNLTGTKMKDGVP
jgi:hypothetical protein